MSIKEDILKEFENSFPTDMFRWESYKTSTKDFISTSIDKLLDSIERDIDKLNTFHDKYLEENPGDELAYMYLLGIKEIKQILNKYR